MIQYPYHPRTEGQDHINTYSKSETVLGRMLSNFAHTPVILPDDGQFASLEAYWYWLSTEDDSLRPLHGLAAKKSGIAARKIKNLHRPDFESKIKIAAQWKLKQNLPILHMLKESTLPLVHYYVSTVGNKRVATPAHGADWLWHHYMVLRSKLRKEPEPIYVPTPKEPDISADGTLSLF